ncbi:SET domain-containing protein 5 [Gnomoniopsis sp. IMI 355080]|nr:SET domain-containing protein 5 [Gnomoniopsis sp. IMI 355080]
MSPLFTAQTPGIGSQCSSNTSANMTADSFTTEPSSEDYSSGGWSGPHACAGSFCVYANPSFAGNRGIAIISDGDSANMLANLPGFVDLASPRAADLLVTANINSRSQGVDTRDIPGKGRGLVASRPIHRGEQIMAYTPALVIHRAFVDELSRAEQLRLLRDAVGRLPTLTRVVFWKQLGQTHEAEDNDILEIVMNNSFNLPLNLSGVSFIGNFPEVSMYNHDCRPSVAFHLESGLVHRTHAVRTAVAGEELSISYVDSHRVREVRRARTKKNWGFECACAQCMLPETLRNASDHRLWRIYEVENSLLLHEGSAQGKHAKEGDVVDKVELLLSLYQQERMLDSHGAVAFKTAALNYNSIRRTELAIKYALLALEAFIIEDGASSDGAREILTMLDEPERHWSWGKRI